MNQYQLSGTYTPSKVGDRVRFVGYGGDVRSYHVDLTGTVVRFNRNGYPVVKLDEPPTHNPQKVEVTDRFNCGRVIDPHNRLARPRRLS